MIKFSQSIIFITLLLFVSTSFAQITYQVRYDTVESGAIYNLGTTTSAPVIQNDEPRIIGRKNLDDIENFEYILDLAGKEVFETVYFEDTTIPNDVNAIGDNALLLQKYNVSLPNNVAPPDPTIAVGPNHVIVLTNQANGIFIYDKQGNLLLNANSDQFFSGVWPNQDGDPQIIFDHFANRWVIVFMQIDDGAQLAGDLLAYSDDDDPFGTWYTYRFPSTLWGDFPQIGFDHQAIYIATNCFSFEGSFQYPQFKIISKDELYSSNGGPVKFTTLYNITVPGSGTKAYSIRPSFHYSISDDFYLLYAANGGGNSYGFYKLSNPTTNPVLTGTPISVTRYYSTPNAIQLGGDIKIESGGSRIRNAPIFKDGYLYAAHSTGNSQGNRSNIRYFILEVTTNSIPEMAEFGAQDYYYIYPALAIDKDNNILVTSSRSSGIEYVGAFFNARRSTDAPGLSNAYTLQEGLAYYVCTFCGSRNRWGDYLGIYVDPANDYEFWMVSQYASATNTYAISVGNVRLQPYPGPYGFSEQSNSDFGRIEVGFDSDTISTILANFGDEDLIINNIPESAGAFFRVSQHSFPLTLSTFDSIEIKFQFKPRTMGQLDQLFPIENNSMNFPGFNLKGYGFIVYPADADKIYAVSGPNNSGNVLTINPASGLGTNIGSSLFTDIIGLSVNPKDNMMYGLRTSSLGSELVRVNGLLGDSYSLQPIGLPSLFSMAFDSSGQLYATTTANQIYSIDVNDGSYSLAATMPVSRVVITFNHLNNELWGSVKSITTPRDRIIKINLLTGDTIRIGQTGFGINTNDLIFDKDGNLYGINGANVTANDFFIVDQTTGAGTLIGSIGYPDIKSLGYTANQATSVNNNKDVLPITYSLEQNYPNPFNPSTTINFSLPAAANVKLTVYNLLGETVKVLFDNQISAGNHSVVWNADDNSGKKISSGIYFYELKASGDNGNNFNQIRKMILLK